MPYTPILSALLLVLLLSGCSKETLQVLPVPATLVPSAELPDFADDLDFKDLSLAVQRQLTVLRAERDREALRIGKVRYRTGQLLASLERFHALLGEAEACLMRGRKPADCAEVFGQRVREQFLIYRVDGALLTAYYTPRIEVSVQRSEKFPYPIYRTPDTARERRLSRDDIDFGQQLDGKGYELYYAVDRFDVYVIHIEGGAHVLVHDDGQTYTRYLHYNADNGREFTNLYEYMLKHGLLEPKKRSRWDQRAALTAHPERAREIFASCPGYVFFKVNDTPPITHTGAALTDNRSLASDPAYYPVKGLISYVVAPIPLPPPPDTPPESNPPGIEYRTMQRFFIDQDIGHHILGPARADLFFGEGPYAEFLGNNFMTKGRFYLLVSK